MKSVSNDPYVALVVTSHSRTEKYIPLDRSLLDTFWPGHPARLFITDGASQSAADVCSFPGLSWVELLSAGLSRIREQGPQTTHVFHMLEDHCPLRSCAVERLERIFAISIRHNLVAVAFPTYSWPWNETEATIYPDGLVRTWRSRETRDLDGELFAVVPRDFFRYFQVQPTLWHLDYLQEACAWALTQGVTDAWNFEAMRWSRAQPHYVSQYNWPTVHHGFLEQGELNANAIAYLDRRNATDAHRMLVREAIGVESPLLFDFLQLLLRAKSRICAGLSRVKRGVLARASATCARS